MKLARATAAVHARDSTDMHVRASRAERGGGGGEERDGEQRKASSEYVESGRQDSHAGTYSRMKTHVGVYAQRFSFCFKFKYSN